MMLLRRWASAAATTGVSVSATGIDRTSGTGAAEGTAGGAVAAAGAIATRIRPMIAARSPQAGLGGRVGERIEEAAVREGDVEEHYLEGRATGWRPEGETRLAAAARGPPDAEG